MTRKNFLYLVQAPDRLPEHYKDIVGATADVILLTFKNKGDGDIFLPNSTWTTGRNRLIQEVTPRLDSYEYIMFLDDDVSFDKGGWRLFEEIVLRYHPAFAVPYCPWHITAVAPARTPATVDAQRCGWFDAIYNAVHCDILKDGLMLPYYAGLDDISWWYSQWCLVMLAKLLYGPHILQVNSVVISNTTHSAYPQSGDFTGVESWFKANVAAPPQPRSLLRRGVGYAVRRLRNGAAASIHAPVQAAASYRLTTEGLSTKLVIDPDTNPFYRQFLDKTLN